MKLVFLFSHCPDPRINKRISELKKYFEVYLIYWNRNAELEYEIIHSDIDNIEIVVPSNYGNALNRLLPTFEFGKKVLNQLKTINPDIIYTGNIDMLYLVWRYHKIARIKPKVVYEIADLHTLIIDRHKRILYKVANFLLIRTEQKLCKIVDLMVLTSEKFYEIYYSKFYPQQKVLFIPNMPNLEAFRDYKKKAEENFCIGFIGAVRYKNQMKMLIGAAEKSGIEVLFAGVGLDDEIEKLCRNKKNVKYHGKYNYDSEIAQLYGEVDCIYSVYNADLNNVKIALPNKLYEAIYCEVPIIVAKGTYLAELVEKMGVGVAVSHEDENELAKILSKMNNDKEYYNSFVESCLIHKYKIDTEFYNKELSSRINKIVNLQNKN